MDHYIYEIMGGVLIFLSSLVSEMFSKKYRMALWVFFALLAGGYTVMGIVLDKDNAATVLAERTRNAKEREDLQTEVTGLRANTSNLITAMYGTLPIIASLTSDIATLRKDTEAAKEQHDPRLIANLQQTAQTAQQQADNLSQEVLALTLAPQIAEQLRSWQTELNAAQQNAHNFEWEEQALYIKSHPDYKEGVSRIQEKYGVQYQQIDKEYQAKWEGLLRTAAFLRKEMLKRIPLERWTPIDKSDEQFAALPRDGLANYLEGLAKRVPPPK